MKSNLAHEPPHPQGEVVQFPKQERQVMPNKDVSYTKTPNYLVDEDYVARMTGNALKCYTIINRFTEGFSRGNWAIDSSFLLKKAGIKKPHTAYDAVKQLEEFGLLSVHREDGRTNKFTITHPCQKTAVVPNLGSAEKRHNPTAEKRHNPTAEKRHTKKENIKKENIKKDICEIFEFWKTTFSKNEKTILSDKRARKIQTRLVDGYQVEDIKHAILNCSKSDYHVQGGYTDIELICREPEKLDRFIAMSVKAPAVELAHPTPEQQPVFKGVAKKYKGVNV